MKKHSAILHGALAEAYKKDMIAANPADKVTLPRKKKFYGQSYNADSRIYAVLPYMLRLQQISFAKLFYHLNIDFRN